MAIDPVGVKRFWEQRALTHADDAGLTNLEEDPELRALKISLEEERVADYMGEVASGAEVLDLGGGNGIWAFKFAPRVGRVHVVDYCEPLVEAGRRKARERGVTNVVFSCSAAQDFLGDAIYDLVFISGLLIYLNDEDLDLLLSRVRTYTHAGSIVILRDGTSILDRRYEISRWSDALQSNYSAIYRTRAEYLHAFSQADFHCDRDDDMFAPSCPLNKFPETRLRIYRLRRAGSGGSGTLFDL